MKRRLHLLRRAIRRWHARQRCRRASVRSQRIRDEYTLLGAELLAALRAEADAKFHMSNTNREQ